MVATHAAHPTHATPAARPAAAAPPERYVAVDAVCSLIEAAGPLSIEDIAAGLDVPVRNVAPAVEWLMGYDGLKLDEWNRLTLSGACRDR